MLFQLKKAILKYPIEICLVGERYEARGLYGGDGISVEEWEKTHLLAMEQLRSLVQSRQDIVVDDTSCFRWLRERFSKATKHFGKVDILVNNAAGKNIFKPNAQMTEQYDSMFDITRGVYFALQEAALQLADGGSIVSISTGGTSMATPGSGAYAGSKAAVEQFNNSLSKLGDRNITVNTVAPGITDTDSLVLEQEQVDQLIAQTLGRLGQPNDLANAIAMLVSDDAGWITEQNIRATGGIV